MWRGFSSFKVLCLSVGDGVTSDTTTNVVRQVCDTVVWCALVRRRRITNAGVPSKHVVVPCWCRGTKSCLRLWTLLTQGPRCMCTTACASCVAAHSRKIDAAVVTGLGGGVGSLGRQVLACEREGKVHSTVPALHQSPFSGHLCSWVWLNFPSNRNQLRPKHSNRKSSTAGVALLPQWRRTAEKQCGEAQYLFKRLHRTTRYRPDCRACKTGEREGAETKYNSTLFTARCFAHSREKLRTDLLSGWRVG